MFKCDGSKKPISFSAIYKVSCFSMMKTGKCVCTYMSEMILEFHNIIILL